MASHKSPSSTRYKAIMDTMEILATRHARAESKKEISHHWISDSGVSGVGSVRMGNHQWYRRAETEQVRVTRR